RASGPAEKYTDHSQSRGRIPYQPLCQGVDQIRGDDLAPRLHSKTFPRHYPCSDARLLCDEQYLLCSSSCCNCGYAVVLQTLFFHLPQVVPQHRTVLCRCVDRQNLAKPSVA